jgi:hypothetical protein
MFDDDNSRPIALTADRTGTLAPWTLCCLTKEPTRIVISELLT